MHSQLTAALRRRLRSTDEVGWFDAKCIGVVLPATPPRGAWKLADDICRNWHESPSPLCHVYCYPSDTAQLDESIKHRRRTDRRDEMSANDAIPNRRKSDPEADALEPLLAQEMPSWKRVLDIFGAIIGLAVLSPIFLLIALAVKLTSPGPILFRQQRTGARVFRL